LNRGQYAEAERYGRLSVRIAERELGAEDLAVAHTLNNLGCTYEEAGKLTQAKDAYQRALAINRAHFGSSNDQLGVNLYNVACVYHKLGRYDEAEPLYQQALDIWNQLLGENSVYAAFAFDRLGCSMRWPSGRRWMNRWQGRDIHCTVWPSSITR
jgi:tetratricopeptide (TPR) repeat protein